MWIYEGSNIAGQLAKWAEKFKEHINDNYKTDAKNERKVFKQALASFVQEHFAHHRDQDKFVHEIGIDECVTWARTADDWKTIKDGLGFVHTVLESVFSQIFYFQKKENENESFLPRTRKYRSLIESALKTAKRNCR